MEWCKWNVDILVENAAEPINKEATHCTRIMDRVIVDCKVLECL